MKRMKKISVWLLMLVKRLYKTPTFLLLLLLIPVLVIGYRFSVQGESGMLTVGLAQQASDPMAEQIIRDLEGSSSLVLYRVFDTPEEAQRQLQAGKLDAVWVFPGDMQSHLEAFTENPSADNAFITVFVRKDNVALALSREKLSGTLYQEAARLVYLSFIRQESPDLSHLSDEELLAYYDDTTLSEDLFTFGDGESLREGPSYLLSPLRGILGVIICLGALATAMRSLRDEEQGLFSWLPARRRFAPELGCQMVTTVHLCAASLLSLAVCGLGAALGRELLIFLLYSLCCAVFAMMLRRLLPSMRLLAAAMPVLCVLMLVICPVFFDLGALRQLQYLLPPTYFICAAETPAYLGYTVLYTAVCGGIFLLAGKAKKA